MDVAKGRRVSAAEAAEMLCVPRYAISRIDRSGEVIKRYKLGHKTHVYEIDSLHAYLEVCLVKPVPAPTVGRRTRLLDVVRDFSSEKQPSRCRNF